ncbi:MAG: Sec-independent protein translocase protein TatB [Betaproteobacteria bacterium]
MFDIGASEIFVISVVALLVIGPERLPRVAKTLGHLFGRLQRYVSEVKSDINRELELEELRKLKSTMQDAARSIEQSVTSQVNYIDSEVKQAGEQIRQAGEEIKQAGSDMKKQVEEAAAPLSGIQLMPASTPASETTEAPKAKSAKEQSGPPALPNDKLSTNAKPE